MLNQKEKKILINIAFESIKSRLDKDELPDFYYGQESLARKAGAFVTLKIKNQLRGCIGLIIPKEPLYKAVLQMAQEAAFRDPRFLPLNAAEYEQLEIEISVLSPLEKIKSVEDIEAGKHGLMVREGYSSGLLLPQVAGEHKWGREDLLDHTCIKAGLDKDRWRRGGLEIYIFTCEVFNSAEI